MISAKSVHEMLAAIPGIACLPVMDDKILFALRCGSGNLEMVAGVDRDVLQFRTVRMLTAPGQNYRTVLLRALVDLNWRYKLAKFAFDASDAEVVAYVDMYLANAKLTPRQLRRATDVLRSVVWPGKERCEKIVATGVDPGQQSLGIAEAVELLQALERHRKGPGERPGGGSTKADRKTRSGANKPRGFKGILDEDPDD